MNPPPVIFDQAVLPHVPPEGMDRLWAAGWRHFGCQFFRYSISMSDSMEWEHIVPLRIAVDEFRPDRSQRRVLRRNADVRIETGPAVIDAEREAMFLRHRERFRSNIPSSIRVFFPGLQVDRVPCECREFRVFVDGRLIAVSYFDVGAEALSSVYAIFEPSEGRRSPGILTMLLEIAYARESGRRFLYPGYATMGPGHYDYKKSFSGLYGLDWSDGTWRRAEELGIR